MTSSPNYIFLTVTPEKFVHETKLLGVTLTSYLSWSKHVDNITRGATRNLWVLIRFKVLGGTTDQLLYTTRVRSILEFAAPVFHCSRKKTTTHMNLRSPI